MNTNENKNKALDDLSELKNVLTEVSNLKKNIETCKEDKKKLEEEANIDVKKEQIEELKTTYNRIENKYNIIKNKDSKPKEYKVPFITILKGGKKAITKHPKLFALINFAIFLFSIFIFRLWGIILFLSVFIIEYSIFSIFYGIKEIKYQSMLFKEDKRNFTKEILNNKKKEIEKEETGLKTAEKMLFKGISEKDKEIENYTKKISDIQETLKNKFKHNISDEDWQYIDSIAEFIEKGRADTIKEALILLDNKKQNDTFAKDLNTQRESIATINDILTNVANCLAEFMKMMINHIQTQQNKQAEAITIMEEQNRQLSKKISDSADTARRDLINDLKYDYHFNN